MLNYETIKEKRLQFGISQIKLANYSGFSPATISGWELKKAIPSEEQLDRLIKSIEELIYQIQHKGLNIKKKRIQKDSEAIKKLPSTIKTAADYKIAMSKIKYVKTEYTNQISKLYQKFIVPLPHNAPNAISLFSGCGGLDLGFRAAGFDLLGHVEIEEYARTIYEANFENSECLGTDVCNLTEEDIDGWLKKYGSIDMLVGGPPCQGFSLVGKRDPNDIRSQLYKDYVRIVNQIQPKVFVMENVRLLTSMKDSEGHLFINKIIESFESIGYNVSLNDVNAQDYGVPQSRERIFLIGISNKLATKFSFPEKTHSNNTLTTRSGTTVPYLTFKDATRELDYLENGEHSLDPLHWSIVHPSHVIEWLKPVPEGCSAHENEDPNLRPPSGFNTTYKRIVWNEPCSTISTNFSMISGSRNVHPIATRSLTIREATRAQSFPDEFVFIGNWGNIRKTIGNAVPPLLSYIVAKAIYDQLFS